MESTKNFKNAFCERKIWIENEKIATLQWSIKNENNLTLMKSTACDDKQGIFTFKRESFQIRT